MKKTIKIFLVALITFVLMILLIASALAIIMFLNNGRFNPSFTASPPVENGTITLCFSRQENCTLELERLLANASQIRASLYELNEPNVKEILMKKNADLVIDEDNYFGYGKKIVKPGLMHNKFFIIYNASGKDYVVTGSTNPTLNDFYKNDNNMEIIDSPTLVRNYEDEFFEIKNQQDDHPTIFPKIIFNGEELDNYFCPDDDCEQKVVDELASAKQSIYFMAYSFTSDRIGGYIISSRGALDIRGVFDSGQSKTDGEYSEYPKMHALDMDVRLDTNKAKLHHKVFIIDNETVITGSYNPTSSGNTRNDENILIIHDKAIAGQFLNEFSRVYGQG